MPQQQLTLSCKLKRYISAKKTEILNEEDKESDRRVISTVLSDKNEYLLKALYTKTRLICRFQNYVGATQFSVQKQEEKKLKVQRVPRKTGLTH
jgi:hypothetical protein